MTEKKVGIVGEIRLEGRPAEDTLSSILKELQEFRKAWSDTARSLTEVEEGSAAAAESLRDMTEAAGEVAGGLEEAAAGAESITEGIEDAAGGLRDAAEGAESITEGIEDAAGGLRDAAEGAREVADSVAEGASETARAGGLTQKLRALWGGVLELWQSATGRLTEVAEGTEEVTEETGRAGVAARVLAGLWQGIGIGLGLGAVKLLWAGLKNVAGALNDAAEAAGQFDDVWTKAAADGVTVTDELRNGAVLLTEAMGTDLVAASQLVARAFDLVGQDAESALDLTRIALMNMEQTGADAAASMEKARQVTQAFGMEGGKTAEVLARVAAASDRTKVSQDELWQAISKLSPQAKVLGISLSQLLAITEKGLTKGLQAAEAGLDGLREVMEAIHKPSEAFAQLLADAGVVSSPAAEGWAKQSTALEGMRGELAGVNQELRDLQRMSSELGILTSEAERRAERYGELNKQQESGDRLNQRERRELRELGRALKGYTKDLGDYDRVAALSSDRDLRRLSISERLSARLKAAAEVQRDLSEESARASLKSDDLASSTGRVEEAVVGLAAMMNTELPAAIRQAVGEQGMGAFLEALRESPELMSQFSGQAQTFIEAAAGAGTAAVDGAAAGQEAIQRLYDTQNALQEQNYGAWDKLKTSVSNVVTQLARPFAAVKDAIAGALLQIMGPEEMGILDAKMNELQSWAAGKASAIGGRIVSDLKAVFAGDKSFTEVLTGWVRDAWNAGEKFMTERVSPFLADLGALFEQNRDAIQEALIKVFVGAVKAALAAAKLVLTNETLTEFFQPIANWTQGMTSDGSAMRPNVLDDYMGPAPSEAWRDLPSLGRGISNAVTQERSAAASLTSGAGGGGGSNYGLAERSAIQFGDINVNGAENPRKFARELMDEIDSLQRLGMTSGRLR